MRRLADALYSIVIALWVGGLWAVGYLAAPILFAELPGSRTLAGNLAGQMFAAISWVGMCCAAYLLLYLLFTGGLSTLKSLVFWLVLAMLGLTLAGYFGIQPILAHLKAEAWPREVMQSAVKDRFATWHGVSSIVYLVASLLGAALAIVQERGKR
jgi:putative copper export protein